MDHPPGPPTCISYRAHTLVHINEVMAGRVVLTRVAHTVVDVRLASVTFKTRLAITAEINMNIM